MHRRGVKREDALSSYIKILSGVAALTSRKLSGRRLTEEEEQVAVSERLLRVGGDESSSFHERARDIVIAQTAYMH